MMKMTFSELKDNMLYDKLKDYIGTGFYEQLIRKHLLDNTNTALVVLKPKAGLNKIREKHERKTDSL